MRDAQTWAFSDQGRDRRRFAARALVAALLLSGALVLPGRVQAIIEKTRGSGVATVRLVKLSTKPTSLTCKIRPKAQKKAHR